MYNNMVSASICNISREVIYDHVTYNMHEASHNPDFSLYDFFVVMHSDNHATNWTLQLDETLLVSKIPQSICLHGAFFGQILLPLTWGFFLQP